MAGPFHRNNFPISSLHWSTDTVATEQPTENHTGKGPNNDTGMPPTKKTHWFFPWIVEILNHYTTGDPLEKKRMGILTSVLVVLVLITVVLLGVLGDALFLLPDFPTWPWNIVLGILIIIPGLILWAWSMVHCLKGSGTPSPFNPPQKLITKGPYAHVRNPMAGGIFIMMFGAGLLLQSISLVFILTPVLIIVMMIYLKYVEEPELSLRLGEAYRNYRDEVPRVFPKVTKKKK